MNNENQALQRALERIYNRSDRPEPWTGGGNLPWNHPDFSKRMLIEHLDESHGAASRQMAERSQQINWLWSKLGLQPGSRLLDVTCGPGLYAIEFATLGCQITGIDFSPASIDHARLLAKDRKVSDRCTFLLQDVRESDLSAVASSGGFDGAIFLYGQLAVFPKEEADALIENIYQSLSPGAHLCIELLNQEKVDKKGSTWWYTDEGGLWGSRPYLHLGERFWVEEEALSIERFQTIHLESGQLDEVILCDQTYSIPGMKQKLRAAGFSKTEVYLAWDGLSLYDSDEWIVYLTRKD